MMKENLRFGLAIASTLGCLSILLVASRQEPERTALQYVNGGGVILTFDDNYTRDWHNADQLLNKYDWRATFFVSGFDSLDSEEVDRLSALQAKGHEIASHSQGHIDAEEFVKSHSLEEYIEAEILPSITAMENEGLVVRSFAYPLGARTAALDQSLLNHFEVLRGTAYRKKLSPKRNSFANGSRVVFGLGIDKSYGNDIKYILEMLQYAKQNNKIAILYAHRVSPEPHPPGYTTDHATLEAICGYVAENNMRFMTMAELALPPE